jgi:hypothetical protein
MKCFNGTRNGRRRATKIQLVKYLSGKESPQIRPNLVEFPSRPNRGTQLNHVKSAIGKLRATGGADALDKWIARPEE